MSTEPRSESSQFTLPWLTNEFPANTRSRAFDTCEKMGNIDSRKRVRSVIVRHSEKNRLNRGAELRKQHNFLTGTRESAKFSICFLSSDGCSRKTDNVRKGANFGTEAAGRQTKLAAVQPGFRKKSAGRLHCLSVPLECLFLPVLFHKTLSIFQRPPPGTTTYHTRKHFHSGPHAEKHS